MDSATDRPCEDLILVGFESESKGISKAHMVPCNVPVLDTPGLLLRVLLVVGNVSDSEDIFLALNPKVLIDRNTLILLQLETTGFQEFRSGSHANSEDEDIRRDGITSLQLDSTDLLGVILYSEDALRVRCCWEYRLIKDDLPFGRIFSTPASIWNLMPWSSRF